MADKDLVRLVHAAVSEHVKVSNELGALDPLSCAERVAAYLTERRGDVLRALGGGQPVEDRRVGSLLAAINRVLDNEKVPVNVRLDLADTLGTLRK